MLLHSCLSKELGLPETESLLKYASTHRPLSYQIYSLSVFACMSPAHPICVNRLCVKVWSPSKCAGQIDILQNQVTLATPSWLKLHPKTPSECFKLLSVRRSAYVHVRMSIFFLRFFQSPLWNQTGKPHRSHPMLTPSICQHSHLTSSKLTIVGVTQRRHSGCGPNLDQFWSRQNVECIPSKWLLCLT